ncbi:subfamily C member 14 [Brachionus plicatilis]|uniref:Subfamily C member 14 n=1 Tax=Brachionus plicatilis TaxID=10195 RepID=A0A3M7QN34_BRAPC|nr:subfamily C member 14 [Brachionus plicatilis]
MTEFLITNSYRKHMVDSLPNVWMIDGLLVTSAERQEVSNFFEESARSSRPTRHKLPKYQFVPSDQKKKDIYGEWSTKLMSKFAVNETKNIETDMRRLEFIAEWFEEIIKVDCSYVAKKHNIRLESCFLSKNFLRNLIDFRKSHTEMCNMVLVLLVASLQFRIPNEFLGETLNYTNLNKINNPVEDTIKLFELPRISRIYISNLLLSAIKIDRDQKIFLMILNLRKKSND